MSMSGYGVPPAISLPFSSFMRSIVPMPVMIETTCRFIMRPVNASVPQPSAKSPYASARCGHVYAASKKARDCAP